ncbi:MAG: sugar transferase, partial [Actinomycetota bacterium]|nr:sugar transferase [Actinomycetota bacterium]
DPRITPVGAIIRRLSVDELAQLVNVIKGEMSLVGPRPLPVDPEEFDVAAQIRHKVAPGITGLWQVHGANALRYTDMVDLDLTYITTRSMGLDLVLLARTLPAVVFRRVKAY